MLARHCGNQAAADTARTVMQGLMDVEVTVNAELLLTGRTAVGL